MQSGAMQWRSCGYARDAVQMAEPRSSVKYGNVSPGDEGRG